MSERRNQLKAAEEYTLGSDPIKEYYKRGRKDVVFNYMTTIYYDAIMGLKQEMSWHVR